MTEVVSVFMGLVRAYTDLLGNQQNWLESKLSQPEDSWHYSVYFFTLSKVPVGIFLCYIDSTRSKHQVCYGCELYFFFSFLYNIVKLYWKTTFPKNGDDSSGRENPLIGKGFLFPCTHISRKIRTYSPCDKTTNELWQCYRF